MVVFDGLDIEPRLRQLAMPISIVCQLWPEGADLFREYLVRRQNEVVELTLDMMSDKTVDARAMITHRFKFEDTVKAFDLVASYGDGVMKAMIDYD